MHPTDWYALLDDVLLREPDRVVTVHQLAESDPFFRDHFPGRPVLPGVLATEALLQACREMLAGQVEDGGRWVLDSAKALRFSQFLTPSQWLVCDVKLLDLGDQQAKIAASGYACDERPGSADALDGLSAAVSGRLVLRPIRLP